MISTFDIRAVVKKMAKYYIRLLIKKKTPYNFIILTSYGRSGSTMLYESLVKSKYHKSLFSFVIERSIKEHYMHNDNLPFIKRNTIIKTHYSQEKLVIFKGKYKLINIISKPSDVIKSLYILHKDKPNIYKRHFKNLGIIDELNFDNIFSRDILNLEKRMEEYKNNKNCLTIKYEYLWDNADVLSDFVGYKVYLPKKINRRASELKDDVPMHLYHNLDKYYDSLEDYF